MNISELAHQTNASIRSLRYYEAKRLLSPHRRKNGYRSYDQTAIERVRYIQFYLRLGLTAEQVFSIVSCGRPDSSPSPFDETTYPRCQEAIDLFQEKLAAIEHQIATLEQAKTYLRQRLAFLIREKHAEVSL
jgi:MerR family transcriptional regulator, Zn(II)-responsive regulator of zntA